MNIKKLLLLEGLINSEGWLDDFCHVIIEEKASTTGGTISYYQNVLSKRITIEQAIYLLIRRYMPSSRFYTSTWFSGLSKSYIRSQTENRKIVVDYSSLINMSTKLCENCSIVIR